MSIIQIHRFQERRIGSPVPGEPPASAVTVYARALAEARILSFKPHSPQANSSAGRSGQTAVRRRLPSVRRPFRMMRFLFAKWMAKRVHARRIRELETVLRNLDPHTLRDIGFDVKVKANDRHASRSNALVQAIKAVYESADQS